MSVPQREGVTRSRPLLRAVRGESERQAAALEAFAARVTGFSDRINFAMGRMHFVKGPCALLFLLVFTLIRNVCVANAQTCSSGCAAASHRVPQMPNGPRPAMVLLPLLRLRRARLAATMRRAPARPTSGRRSLASPRSMRCLAQSLLCAHYC